VIVRLAEDADRESALEIERRAFGEPRSAAIVTAVWDARGSFGLIAEEDDVPIGHVQFSTATIGDDEVLALGPIGVVPEHQGRGVGSALIEAGAEEARARGAVAVILLGAPSSYGRFGFVPGSTLGLANLNAGVEEGVVVSEDAFQVLPLGEWAGSLHGPVRWHRAFSDPTAN